MRRTRPGRQNAALPPERGSWSPASAARHDGGHGHHPLAGHAGHGAFTDSLGFAALAAARAAAPGHQEDRPPGIAPATVETEHTSGHVPMEDRLRLSPGPRTDPAGRASAGRFAAVRARFTTAARRRGGRAGWGRRSRSHQSRSHRSRSHSTPGRSGYGGRAGASRPREPPRGAEREAEGLRPSNAV
jgi:hypothetical protein